MNDPLTVQAIYEQLTPFFKELKEGNSDKSNIVILVGAIGDFIEHFFRAMSQPMASMTWLIIAEKYPSLAGSIMESMDSEVFDTINPFVEAINKLYLETRE